MTNWTTKTWADFAARVGLACELDVVASATQLLCGNHERSGLCATIVPPRCCGQQDVACTTYETPPRASASVAESTRPLNASELSLAGGELATLEALELAGV